MRLVLFDIDGTLIDSGGAGTRALELAIMELFSINNAFKDISMAGKTDKMIIKEGLRKHGIPADGNISSVISAYLRHLKREILNERKHVKPGMHELLQKLRYRDDICIGLLTGNLEEGARIKLEPFKLNQYFPSGAFGSDDEDRNNLLPIAVRRFVEMLQINFDIRDCIIIGDTPRDVECAHIYGAKCFGVATGPYTIDDLLQAGADYAVRDLSEQDPLLQIL